MELLKRGIGVVTDRIAGLPPGLSEIMREAREGIKFRFIDDIYREAYAQKRLAEEIDPDAEISHELGFGIDFNIAGIQLPGRPIDMQLFFDEFGAYEGGIDVNFPDRLESETLNHLLYERLSRSGAHVMEYRLRNKPVLLDVVHNQALRKDNVGTKTYIEFEPLSQQSLRFLHVEEDASIRGSERQRRIPVPEDAETFEAQLGLYLDIFRRVMSYIDSSIDPRQKITVTPLT